MAADLPEQQLPGWRFTVEEVTNDYWRVDGFYNDGRSVSRGGFNIDAFQRECIEDANTLAEKRPAQGA
jgi:hypothetical protein